MAEPKRPRMRPAVVAALAAGVVAALAVATGAYSGWSPTSDGGDEEVPDLVLYNGKISTVDEDGSTVRAVAIRDGKILATGSSRRVRALARPSTIVVNLRGRRVLPGLIDGHLHGLRNGYHCFTQAVRLDNVTSRRDAIALYAAKAAELADGRWILTPTGWTVRQLDEPGMLTLAELDAAAPDNPVWVQGFGFQGVQVNSAALEAAGLVAGMPGVVLDPAGEPTGQLTGPALEAAGAKVVQQLDALSIDEQAECLADFVRVVNALGLTAWKDPDGNQQPFNPQGSCSEFSVGLHGHQPVLELWRRNRLDARVAFHMMNNFGGLAQVLADTRNPLGFLGDDRLRYLGVGEVVFCPGNQPPPAEYLEISRHLARNQLSFASDAMNVAPFTPFVRLWYAVSGRTFDPEVPGVPPDQRLTRAEALRASTADCAWNLAQEDRLGSIEPGKHADLIVLSGDYFRVPTDEIRSLRSR